MTSELFREWSQLSEWGGGKNSKVGGWIYYLNNSKELVLIALHICDGKTTVPKGGGGGESP